MILVIGSGERREPCLCYARFSPSPDITKIGGSSFFPHVLLGKFGQYASYFWLFFGCCFLSDTMAFDLDSFARNLTLQPLNKCKKVDLMLIANCH